MAVTITRTAWTDDDGTGTTGTVINNAVKTELYNQIDTALAAVSCGTRTETGTGTLTALALPTGAVNGGVGVIYMNNASAATIQGIAAGAAGQRVRIVSTGAGQVDLAHQNAGATAANRLINFATSGNTPLAAGIGVAELEYDAAAARWRLATHEQGAWITPTYAAGNFTASTGTWTVDSGDVTSFGYFLKGRTVTVEWNLSTTSVSATPATLSIGNGAWGGFTAARQTFNTTVNNDNASGNAVGVSSVGAAATLFGIAKINGNFAIATNATNVFGQIAFEVQ